MRRIIVYSSLVMLVLGMASLSIPRLAMADVDEGKQEHKLVGQVVSVDPAGMTLIAREDVKGGRAVEITFNVVSDAKVLINGRSGSLEDLRPGDAVTVKYVTHHGRHMAKVVMHA